MAKSSEPSMVLPTAPANPLRSLKKGSKGRNSIDLREQIPQLQSLEQKNIPILYVQTKSTQIKPITILYNHDGNESLYEIKEWLAILSEIFKANIVAWEYPGFSKGSKYSESKTASHIKIVWKFIIETLGVPPTRVILYGKGAGCGPALSLAYKLHKNMKSGTENAMNRLAGIILINIPIVGKQLDFEGIGKEQVKKITTPVVFINSTAMPNQKDIMEFYQAFAFKSGIHLINSSEIDFEEEKLEEMCVRMNKFIITLFPEYKDIFSGVELQKMKPVETYTDPIDIIRNFLTKHGLESLTENMIAFGYLSIDDLLTIEQIDIDSFGFEEEIGKKLLDCIINEKKQRASQSSDEGVTQKEGQTETANLNITLLNTKTESNDTEIISVDIPNEPLSESLESSMEKSETLLGYSMDTITHSNFITVNSHTPTKPRSPLRSPKRTQRMKTPTHSSIKETRPLSIEEMKSYSVEIENYDESKTIGHDIISNPEESSQSQPVIQPSPTPPLASSRHSLSPSNGLLQTSDVPLPTQKSDGFEKMTPRRKRLTKQGSLQFTSLGCNIKDLSTPKRSNRRVMEFNIEDLRQLADPYQDLPSSQSSPGQLTSHDLEVASFEEAAFQTTKRRHNQQRPYSVLMSINKSSSNLEFHNINDSTSPIERRAKSSTMKKQRSPRSFNSSEIKEELEKEAQKQKEMTSDQSHQEDEKKEIKGDQPSISLEDQKEIKGDQPSISLEDQKEITSDQLHQVNDEK